MDINEPPWHDTNFESFLFSLDAISEQLNYLPSGCRKSLLTCGLQGHNQDTFRRNNIFFIARLGIMKNYFHSVYFLGKLSELYDVFEFFRVSEYHGPGLLVS